MKNADAAKIVGDVARDLQLLLPAADDGTSVVMYRCISGLKQIEVQLKDRTSAETTEKELAKRALVLATEGLISFYKAYPIENT